MYVTILFTNQIDKYWHSSQWSDPESQKNRVRFEEVFHMMTQYGYGLQWPSQFSLDGSTNSTLLKECYKATCVWWQHPENNCPDKTATDSTAKACTAKWNCTGTCSQASCNCVEWFHQVISIHDQSRGGVELNEFRIVFKRSQSASLSSLFFAI